MAKARRPAETWLDLFDPAYLDRCCYVLSESIKGAALGEPSKMQIPLRRFLVAELDRYIKAHWEPGKNYAHVMAAQSLQDSAVELAERFEVGEVFELQDADRLADELRLSWLQFIAAGAASRMYHDWPKERADKVAAAQAPRGDGVGITAELVAERMRKDGVSVLSQDLAASIAEEFRVSESTVYRRLKEAKARNLLS